ncbi:MAG: tetratricopeptide repeat protein [Planctomycetota bacterium]
MPEDIDKLLAAYQIDPMNENLFNTLKGHFFLSRDWKSLVNLYFTRGRFARDFQFAANAFMEAARICKSRLGDNTTHVKMLEHAFKASPRHKGAASALGLAYADQERWEDAVAPLEAAVVYSLDRKEIRDLKLRLADILLGLKRVEKAERYLQEILEENPGDREIIERLEKVLFQEGRYREIANILEQTLLSTPQTLDRETAFRLATLYRDHLQEPLEAAVWFEKLNERKPHPMLLAELEKIYETHERFEELAKVLERAIPLADPQDARSIQFRLGRLLREKLNRPEEGAQWIEKSMGEGPTDPRALKDLADVYRQASRWEDLLDILQRQVEQEEDAGAKAEKLVEIGTLFRDRTGNPRAAVAPFQQAYSLAANPKPLLEELDRTFDALGAPGEFAEWLESRVEETPSEDRLELIERAAEGYLAASDPSRAADLFLKSRPDHAGDPAFDQRLIDVLKIAGRTGDLAKLLQDQASEIADPSEKIFFLLDKAKLLAEEPGRESDRIETYREILGIQPDHEEALRELTAVLEQVGKFEELLDLLTRSVELTQDLMEVSNLHVQAGRLLLDRIQDPQRAVERFRAALYSKQDHLEAARGLTDAARVLGERETLLEALSLQAELEPEISDTLNVRLEQVDLLLEEGKTEEAAARLEEAVALDPANIPALEKLKSLYITLERPRDHASVLERLAMTLTDREDAARIYQELGRLYGGALGEKALSAEAYERALAFSPGEEEILLALDALYQELGVWMHRVRILETVARGKEGREGIPFWIQAAGIAESHRQMDKAVQILQRAREVLPSSVEVIDETARVLREADRPEDLLALLVSGYPHIPESRKLTFAREIAGIQRDALDDVEGAVTWLKEIRTLAPEDTENLEALVDLLESTGKPEEALEYLQVLLPLLPEGEERARARVRAGRVLETGLQRPDDALEHFQGAVAMAPRAEGALEGMKRVAESLHDFDAAVKALEVSLTTHPEKTAETLKELCRIHETRRLDLDAAMEAAERWHAAAPEDPRALRTLASLYRRLDRYEEMTKTLETLVETETDDPSRADILRELAEIRWLRHADYEGTEKALKKVAEILPKSPEPLEALERFYLARERHEDRLKCMEALVELDPESPAAPFRHCRIGRAYEESLGDLAQARKHYDRALALDAECLPAIRGLERLAERAGDYPQLTSLVEKEVHLPGIDPDHKRKALQRLGGLRRDLLSDEEGAIEAFREVLEIDPKDRIALHCLEALYHRRNAHGELAEVLQALTGVLLHERDRRNAWFRLGLLHLESLSDPATAVEEFGRALDLDPHYLPAVRKLQEAHLALGNPRERLEALDREIGMDLPHPRRLERLREAGRGWTELGENERAVDRWMKVIESDPGDLDALDALESLLPAMERYEDLAHILDCKWKVPLPRGEKLAAGADRAILLEDRLNRHEEARHLLRAVLEGGERSAELLERYRHLCERANDFRGLAWCLDREIECAADPERRMRLMLEAGALRRESLQDREGAIERFQAAWAAYPESLSSEGSLEGEKAFTALRDLYSETERYEDLVRLLRRRAAFQEGEARGWTYAEAARILEEHLKEDTLAARTYQLALEFAPTLREALRGVARLLAAQGRYGEVVAYRLEEVAIEEDEKIQTEILLEVARIQEQDLQDADQAILTYERVIESTPGHPLAFEALSRLLPRRERYRELAARHAQQAKFVSPEEAVRHEFEAGKIYLEKLNDPDAALRHLRTAFEANPENEEIAEGLEEALRRRGDVEALAAVKEKRLSLLPQEEEAQRLVLCKAIGHLYTGDSANLRRAVGFWVAALKIAPSDLKTVRSLEDLYSRQGDLSNLARMLDHESKVLEDAAERKDVRRRLGNLYMNQLGAFEDAVRVFREMLREDPGETWILESLKRAYRASGRPDELINTYELELAQVEDPSRRAEIRVTLGRIRKRLGLLEEAVSDLKQALEMVPRTEEAIEVLFEVYQALQDAEGMAEMLEQKASLTPLPEEKEYLTSEAGSLWEEAGRADRAIGAYQATREVQPQNGVALDGLGRLFSAQERWEELVEVLSVKADITRSEEEAVSLYSRLGSIWFEHLDNIDRAEESFLMAYEMNEGYLPMLEGLEKIARAREDWPAAVDALDQQIARHQDPLRCAYLGIEAGKILWERLEDWDQALTRFQEALKGDPEALEALWGIASITFEKEDWEAAAPPLEQLTELMDPGWEDPGRQALLHFRCGFVKQELDRPPEEAILHFERALKVDPDHLPSLREAASIYVEASRWEKAKPLVERLLERHATALPEGEVQRLKVDLGILLWKTGDPEGGAEYLEACPGPPEERRALGALEALYLETTKDDKAIEVLERICGSAEEEGEVTEANIKIGRIFLDRKGDGTAAAKYFGKALENRPEDPEARRGLAQAYEKERMWEEGTAAWRALAESDVDAEVQIEALNRLGRIHLAERKDPKAARDAFQRALSIDVTSDESLRGIAKAKKRLKDWKGLAADYRAALEAMEEAPPNQKAPLHFRLGEALQKDGDLEGATSALESAVEGNPHLTGAHLILARLYEKQKKTLPKSTDHYRAVLHEKPVRTDALRRLSKVFTKRGMQDHAFVPAAILVTLRTHNASEFQLHQEHADTAPPTPNGLKGERVRKIILAPGTPGSAHALFQEVDEFLGDIAGADLARYGIRRRKRPEGLDPILAQAGELAAAMGIPPCDVLLSEKPVEEGVALETLRPPALVVGRDLLKTAPAERAFLMGRALAFIKEGLGTARLVPDQVERVLLALASTYIPEAEEKGGIERADRLFRKKVRGSLPRRVRKRMEPLVRAWWEDREGEDPEAFHLGALASADRMGLICCADPCAAIQAKLRFDGERLQPEEMETGAIQTQIGNTPDILALIDFALSDAFQEALSISRKKRNP